MKKTIFLYTLVFLIGKVALANELSRYLASATVTIEITPEAQEPLSDGGPIGMHPMPPPGVEPHKVHGTGFVFKPDGDSFLIITVAHCCKRKHSALAVRLNTSSKESDYVPATLVAIGNNEDGRDYAVLKAFLPRNTPTLALGDENLDEPGSLVASTADIGNIGVQYTVGYITLLHAVAARDFRKSWEGNVAARLGGGLGSSGSPLYSLDQNAVIGVIVGGSPAPHGDIITFAAPASRLKKFLTDSNIRP